MPCMTFCPGSYTNGTNALSLTKDGTGSLTLTNINTATGTLTVNQGGIVLDPMGLVLFATDTINSGGSITVDNTATALNNRLGGSTKNVNIQGGSLTLNGNGMSAVIETIGTLSVLNGGGKIALNGAAGGSTSFTVTTLTAEAVNSGGSLLIQGLSTTTGAGFANMTAPAAGIAVTGVTQGTGTNWALHLPPWPSGRISSATPATAPDPASSPGIPAQVTSCVL